MSKAVPESPVAVVPGVMSGDPVFVGTRVRAEQPFLEIAAGRSIDQIVEDFPALRREWIVSAILRASWLLAEEAKYPEPLDLETEARRYVERVRSIAPYDQILAAVWRAWNF